MRGIWLILFAAILWGTTGTAQELGPRAATPLAVGSLRLLVGAGALVVIAMFRSSKTDWRWLIRGSTVVAAIGMAAYQPFFFSGVARTGVALGTTIAIGSGPVFVGFIEAVRSRGRPNRGWVISTTLAIAGLALIGATAGQASIDIAGVMFALGAGLSYAVYAVAAARLAPLGPVPHSAAAIFGLAAVILIPIAAAQELSFVRSTDGLTMILWLGLAATAAAYLLFTTGLRTIHTGAAATLTLGEPVTATLLAVLVLAERPPPSAWAGIALIVIGLALAARGSTAEPHELAHP